MKTTQKEKNYFTVKPFRQRNLRFTVMYGKNEEVESQIFVVPWQMVKSGEKELQ